MTKQKIESIIKHVATVPFFVAAFPIFCYQPKNIIGYAMAVGIWLVTDYIHSFIMWFVNPPVTQD